MTKLKAARAAGVLVVVASLLSMLFAPRPAMAQVTRVGLTTIASTTSGQCLDIRGGSTQSGAVAEQTSCRTAPNEEWDLQPTKLGFIIIEQQTNLCLAASGSAVVQSACNASGTTWTITPAGNAFKISSASGLCLTAASDSTSMGAAMTASACTDPTLATWVFQSGLIMPTQLATFQADNSGQCAMVAAAGASFAGTLVQNPCAGTPPEQWHIVPTTTIYAYQMVLGSNGLCLTAGSVAVGAALTPTACNGSGSQMFSMWPTAPGYLLNLSQTGLCVDVSGASIAAGAQIVLASCKSAQDDQWSLATASVPVRWTGVIPLNADPVAVANLPNGTLLTWESAYPFLFDNDIASSPSGTYSSIFTPATLTSAADQFYAAGADMFCPGTANLADGRILVNGGSSSPRTTLYDPVAGTFTADANMNYPRGYESDTLLSNGSVLTMGGSWSGATGGKNGEVWTAGQGWTVLPNVPEDPIIGPDPQGIYRGDNHAWMFSFSNGIVLQAGPSAQMHWILTSGPYSGIYAAGPRADDPYSINGNAVMYDVGKILKAGGAPAYNGGVATSSAYTITYNNGLTVTKVAPMTYPRGFSNGVALPNGQVLIVGGQTLTQPFTDTYAVLVPELWDPLTSVFQQLAPMQTPRTYHSTAILLNDGRVFVGGGGLCGQGCAQNHFDTEILTPPYLLNADGSAATRPVITAAPATAPPGSTITVATNGPVSSFALMRNSSTTHTVNNDQRRIPLVVQTAAQSGSGNSYTVTIPADTGVTLPGYYMLFALNAAGVPSVAASVLIH